MKRIAAALICMIVLQKMQAQTVDEIINKHIEAIGGYEKLKAIKTLIIEFNTRFPDRIRNSKSYIIQDSAIHTDNTNSKGEMGYGIVTKTEGWTFDAIKNTIERKSKGEIRQGQYAFDIHGPLIDYKRKGNKIKFLGKETIDGSEYLKLRVIMSNKDRLVYYFDSAYFPFRVQYLISGSYLSHTIDYTYQAFEGGYFFVYKSKDYEGGAETVYTKYIINPDIDRSLFVPHNVTKKKQYH